MGIKKIKCLSLEGLNRFYQQLKIGLDALSKDRHTHKNQDTLDKITETEREQWDLAATAKHSHLNKSALDEISSDEMGHWDDAYRNMHTHANQEILNGITEQKIEDWNGKADAETVSGLSSQMNGMQSVKTVYVNAASGSDSNTGSSATRAFATLEKALEATQYAKKVVIHLEAGTYDLPDASVTWIGRDIRIYGNTAADTFVYGSLTIENSYVVLSRITLRSDGKNAITVQYNADLRIVSSEIASISDYCLFLNYDAKAVCSSVLFSMAEKRAVQLAGSSDARIYTCTDNTGNGVFVGGNCIAYLNDCNRFTYANNTYGMVYINGQQVAPQTESTAAILSMGGNV